MPAFYSNPQTIEDLIDHTRLRSHRLPHTAPDVPLAFFEATLESARVHVAPYAAVTTGSPSRCMNRTPRWHRQIAALRAAG